jgi:sulfite reductase (ferredoxin)
MSDKDTGLSYLHIGFYPKICKRYKRFQNVLGGGLGSQPVMPIADRVYSANQIIPTTEGILRFYDRYERAKRLKARLKFLLKEIGKRRIFTIGRRREKALSCSRN